MTIQEAKQKVAIKYGYKNWRELHDDSTVSGIVAKIDEAWQMVVGSMQEEIDRLKEKIYLLENPNCVGIVRESKQDDAWEMYGKQGIPLKPMPNGNYLEPIKN